MAWKNLGWHRSWTHNLYVYLLCWDKGSDNKVNFYSKLSAYEIFILCMVILQRELTQEVSALEKQKG